MLEPPSSSMTTKPSHEPALGGLSKERFNSSAPAGILPSRVGEPFGQMLLICEALSCSWPVTPSAAPATTSMSIQNSTDSPSTDQPWTAMPYSPSAGSAMVTDSEDVLLQDLLDSSSTEKLPSPSSSWNR